ncbi:hypothetical protein AMTRI_Chr10g300 [Amborella trichopoda]
MLGRYVERERDGQASCTGDHLPGPRPHYTHHIMEFSHRMVEYGFAITFVNTDYNHKRVLEAAKAHPQDRLRDGTEPVRLVSIPDGRKPGAAGTNLIHSQSILSSMPHALEKLINDITNVQGLELHSKRLGFARAAVWPTATTCLTVFLKIPDLVQNGILHENGLLGNRSVIQLAPNTPLIDRSHFPWLCIGDTTEQKAIYRYFCQLINSLDGLESATFDSFPNLLRIGPLLQSNHHGQPTSIWTEDETCLDFTLFDKRQLHELALALENLGRPFLWVARPDLIDKAGAAYPEGFLDRVGAHGKVVGWCPQRKVLAHPSIACFMTHCGWNSTIEGVSNGMPLICWPYSLEGNKDGIFSKEEMRGKVEELLGDQAIRERALKLKEQAIYSVTEGTSRKNLTSFIEAMKRQA